MEHLQQAQLPQPRSLKQQVTALIGNFLAVGLPYEECVKAFRKEFIVLVLLAHKGNQCKAARALGMHRNTLNRTMHELKIDRRTIGDVRLKLAAKPALKPAQYRQRVVVQAGEQFPTI